MKTRKQRRHQRNKVYLLVYFLSVVTITILWALTGDWVRYYKLSRDRAIAVGRIAGTEAAYSVGGQEYTVSLPTLFFYSKYSVEVIYHPSNPRIACVCDPQESLKTEGWWVLLIALGFSLFILVGYHHFRKDYWD
jgi:amino acid transporter